MASATRQQAMIARTSAREGGAGTSSAIDSGDFQAYQNAIIHDWLRSLTVLVVILVPLFFVLDFFMMPAALLPRFAFYRLGSTLIALVQLVVVRNTLPGRWSHLHGDLISVHVGAMITLMTTDLGGFNSSYYAGLNLVIIGVNLMMPWRAAHTAINSVVILGLYVTLNRLVGVPYDRAILVNNLFFLCSTAVVAVSINHVRHKLIGREFSLLVELKKARDALWSEMGLAKRIQTAVLPQNPSLRGYEIAMRMLPATEVGGDYCDVIEAGSGAQWIAIGDVSGHGVDSGLIMMMAQTSVMTAIKGNPAIEPLEVLRIANRVLREDISRLGSRHYMTLMVIRLEGDRMTVAGHHQDLLLYQAALGKVVPVATRGTWLGITDDIGEYMEVRTLELADNDALLLFTDGVTEGASATGEMYGQERLQDALERCADLPAQRALERILAEARDFQLEQEDDMTLILLKRSQGRT